MPLKTPKNHHQFRPLGLNWGGVLKVVMPCKPSELSRTLSLMVFPRSLTNMGVKGTPTTVFTQLSGSLEMITEFTLLKLLNVVYLRSREVPITGSSSGKFPQPTCYRGFVAVGFQQL